MSLLNQNEIESLILTLSGWEVIENKLHKVFQLKDFKEAFRFMTG